MRVLIVTSQSEGGIWHYACFLSKALAKAGVEVALAAPFPFELIQGADDVPVRSLGSRSPSATPLLADRLRRMLNHLDKLRRFCRLVVEFRPDIVHLHDRFGQLDFAYFRLLRTFGVRIVYTAHDVRSLFGEGNWFDRARYSRADAVLVHSSNGVADLIADGIEASRVVRVPHANYLRLSCTLGLSSARAKYLLGIPPGGQSILFFGFIAPYKGLSTLIDAFAYLLQEDPNVYLIIAGRPKEDFAPYKRQIEKLQVEKHIISDLRYIPFDEFGKFFLAADVVAFPYRRIYQSGVLQLAYAFGRPVAVTNVGGLGETVAEDRTGLVAPLDDARGMATAIRELLSDPLRAEEMGERGRQLATTKYSWDAVAKKVIEVYRCLYATPASSCRRAGHAEWLDEHEEGKRVNAYPGDEKHLI